MKKIRVFLSEKFSVFFWVKFSIYLNRRVFVMIQNLMTLALIAGEKSVRNFYEKEIKLNK